MSESKKISAHVQSFVEADVTSLWDWREKNKSNFLKNENEKLTFTPLFIFSVIKALAPMIQFFPILALLRITAPIPIKLLSPIVHP